MGIYVKNVKEGRDENLRLTSMPDADYFVDDPHEIDDLPKIGEISGGAVAFVINTGQVFILGKDGWREIL